MTSMGAGGTDMPTAALFHPLLLAPHGLPLIVSERPVRRGGSTAGATAMGLGVRTALRAPLWGHRHRWRGDVRLLPEVVGSEGTAVLLCCHCRLSSKTVPYLAVRVRWEPRWRAHKAGNRRRRTPTGAVSAALMTEIQQVTALPFARVSTAVLLQASAFLCEFAKNPNLRIQICKERHNLDPQILQARPRKAGGNGPPPAPLPPGARAAVCATTSPPNTVR